MNKIKFIKYIPLLTIAAASLTGCSDDDMFTQDGKDAFILWIDGQVGMKVTGQSGDIYGCDMVDDVIYIRVDPMYNVDEELNGVVPEFFMSKGSTASPAPWEPQDFSKDGGVTYIITSEDGKTSHKYTVTYKYADTLPYGEGFNSSQMFKFKSFSELGWPGEYGNTSFADTRQAGDLNGYVAFCGSDHVVVAAEEYLNPVSYAADPAHGIKVFTYPDLEPAGDLNLGSLSNTDILTITSDSNGVMVAVVGSRSESTCKLYYWTSPTAEPVLAAALDVNLASANDMSNYLQVMGDIKGQANVCAAAPHSATGEQYMIHFEGGQAVSTEVISTGLSSLDCNCFQMISPFTADVTTEYILSDTQGRAGATKGAHIYLCDAEGNQTYELTDVTDKGWNWFVGAGSSLVIKGGKRPYTTAMNINGKLYSIVQTGTSFYWGATVYSADLKTKVDENLRYTSDNMSMARTYGGTTDWCWSDSRKVGQCVYWHDRGGLVCARMKCLK